MTKNKNVYVSHKLMRELKEEISLIISNNDEIEQIYEILKTKLKYDEEQKIDSKYAKTYYEKNKEKINKNTVEKRKLKNINNREVKTDNSIIN